MLRLPAEAPARADSGDDRECEDSEGCPKNKMAQVGRDRLGEDGDKPSRLVDAEETAQRVSNGSQNE